MADKFVIAVETRPSRPDYVPFDDQMVLCSDSFLNLGKLSKSTIVVSGGLIGAE